MNKILIILTGLILSSVSLAHGGRLDSQGCHGGSQPYHCHRSASEMVPATSGGSRLKCSAGSRSKDCNGVSSSIISIPLKQTTHSLGPLKIMGQEFRGRVDIKYDIEICGIENPLFITIYKNNVLSSDLIKYKFKIQAHTNTGKKIDNGNGQEFETPYSREWEESYCVKRPTLIGDLTPENSKEVIKWGTVYIFEQRL